jgi:hypothetical protein
LTTTVTTGRNTACCFGSGNWVYMILEGRKLFCRPSAPLECSHVHQFSVYIRVGGWFLAISPTASSCRFGLRTLLSPSVGAAAIGHTAGWYENFACSNRRDGYAIYESRSCDRGGHRDLERRQSCLPQDLWLQGRREASLLDS